MALPAATHLRTEQRKWGNQLQSGGGWCVRTIIVPGGMISLWIGGSFMEVLNPVAFFSVSLSEHQRVVCRLSNNEFADGGCHSRVRRHFNQTFTHMQTEVLSQTLGQQASTTSGWLELAMCSVLASSEPDPLWAKCGPALPSSGGTGELVNYHGWDMSVLIHLVCCLRHNSS